MTDHPRSRDAAPAARRNLLIASVIVGLQSATLLGVAIAEVMSTRADRLGLGLSTALFFVALGLALGWAARCLLRADSWARGPVVLIQLIQIGLAWNLRGSENVAIPLVLVATAAVALVAVLAPSTTAVLTDDPERDSADS